MGLAGPWSAVDELADELSPFIMSSEQPYMEVINFYASLKAIPFTYFVPWLAIFQAEFRLLNLLAFLKHDDGFRDELIRRELSMPFNGSRHIVLLRSRFIMRHHLFKFADALCSCQRPFNRPVGKGEQILLRLQSM